MDAHMTAMESPEIGEALAHGGLQPETLVVMIEA